MGDAFQCDRCDDFQEGEPPETIPLARRTRRREERVVGAGPYTGPNVKTETMVNLEQIEADLCDECSQRLANFLNGNLGFPDP